MGNSAVYGSFGGLSQKINLVANEDLVRTCLRGMSGRPYPYGCTASVAHFPCRNRFY